MDGGNTHFLLGWPIFRGELSVLGVFCGWEKHLQGEKWGQLPFTKGKDFSWNVGIQGYLQEHPKYPIFSEAGGIQKIGIFTCTSIPVFQFNFHENFTPTIPGQSWGVNVGIKRGPFNSLNIFETSPPLKVQLSSSSKKKTSYQCSTPSFHSYRCWW